MEDDLEDGLHDISLIIHSGSEAESSATEQNLEIGIEATAIPGCLNKPKPKREPDIIEILKEEIEKQVEEKAEESKLTPTNVKTIIKEILSPEHIRTLLLKHESDESDDSITEPKLTRAKAKELFPPVTNPSVPSWIGQPPPSETHILIGDDLKEDDSGDEYVPGEEVDDDKSAASESDTSSLAPPTPPTIVPVEDVAISSQTTYTDDGVFKIPPPKVTDELDSEELLNIALRTRSKINLSSTALEELEQSFIPPDITTDMYDLDCDDNIWKDFLKGFTQPLDEINRPNDEEEHDPEYNILADDEIVLYDPQERDEERRKDKGVQVTRKEIRTLFDELYDYLRDISEEYGDDDNQQQTQTERDKPTYMGFRDQNQNPEAPRMVFEQHQINILEQQMRQHIQMLAQNFLLSYTHPEYHQKSFEFRDFLLNLRDLAGDKMTSVFRQVNLLPAIQLTEDWVKLFTTDAKEVVDCREHIITELAKSLQLKMAGNSTYVLTFPRLVLETVVKSTVFMYPSLLPKIPFKLEQFFRRYNSFGDAEDRLLVFGLDDVTKLLAREKNSDKIRLKERVALVHELLMPHRTPQNIMRHVLQRKHPKSQPNPIQQYFMYNTVSPVIHYLHPTHEILAPCQRSPEELPYQWRIFLYPEESDVYKPPIKTTQNVVKLPQQVILINSPIVPSSNFAEFKSFGSVLKRRISPLVKKTKKPAILNKGVTSIDKFIFIIKRPIRLQKLVQFFAEFDEQEENCETDSDSYGDNEVTWKMSSMPGISVLTTGIDIKEESEDMDVKKLVIVSTSSQEPKKCTKNLDFSKISSMSFQSVGSSSEVEFYKNSGDVQVSQTSHCEEKSPKPKENTEENVVTSTTTVTKTNTRKELSGAEKKKNKLKKEFLANLSIATPIEKEKEILKSETFALAYYDKLRETLKLDDYKKIMLILSEFKMEDVVDLYRQVREILEPNYPDLAEEFLYFLQEKEAAAVGQLIPWLEMQARIKFCHKLEIYFKDQPAQLKKIYNTLMELSKMNDLSMEKIRTALLPLLKGNGILTDLFLQNFKDEAPPPSLMTEPFETISIDKHLAVQVTQAICEKFVVPNMEDKYGGTNCVCHCHKIEDNDYQTRYKHCNSCGLRFIQGEIFIQSGRGLQPATISFSTCPKRNLIKLKGVSIASNHLKKIGHQSQLSTSPNKQTPPKEVLDELQDSEDEDAGKRKKPLAQKATAKRKKTVASKALSSTKASASKKSPVRISDGPNTGVVRKRTAKRRNSGTIGNSKKKVYRGKAPDAVDGPLTDDCMDSSGESLEKPLTPEQQTAESENEFLCEESSQDNYESDSSSSSVESVKGFQSDNNTNEDDDPWKREEDTIILETFQKEDNKEYALQIISNKLPHRTRRDINGRFSKLMALLLETLNNQSEEKATDNDNIEEDR